MANASERINFLVLKVSLIVNNKRIPRGSGKLRCNITSPSEVEAVVEKSPKPHLSTLIIVFVEECEKRKSTLLNLTIGKSSIQAYGHASKFTNQAANEPTNQPTNQPANQPTKG
ncbi:hypothetical protein GQX74_005180, partial [Glossina fuscipes]